MLFVAAVRDLIPDENKKRKLDKSFLFNIDEGFKEVRLEQIEKDYKTYLQILCHEEIFNKNSIVYTNYKFFYDKLSEYLTLNPGAPLEELVTEGLGKFQIVAIELDPIRYRWENPQDIFESMNSLGKPLSLSDLVRNYLLIGFNPDKQRKLYKDYWMKIEDNLSGHISDFIRDYMQMEGHKDFKKATPSNSKELYRDFKTLFSDRSPEELMKDLSRFSEFYSWIINSDCHSGNKKVDRLLSDFRHIKASVIHSLLLELLVKWQNGEIDEFTLIEIMDVFRIFLLRRRTMQLTTAENKAFPGMSNDLPMIIDSEDPRESTFSYLQENNSRMRFPSNDEIREYLKSTNFYSLAISRFLLALVEEHLTKCLPDLNDDRLQREHILPQTLSEEWKKELGPNAQHIQDVYSENIGNITLIRHNQELSNKTFSKKKEIYKSNSGLQIAKTKIIENDLWGEKQILERRDWIIDYLIHNVMPVPDDLVFVNSTKSAQKRRISFSKLGLVGKKIDCTGYVKYFV